MSSEAFQVPKGPPKTFLLGDKIALPATSIARLFRAGCIDKETNDLKPDSGCAKMKARLNAGMSIAKAMTLRIKGE